MKGKQGVIIGLIVLLAIGGMAIYQYQRLPNAPPSAGGALDIVTTTLDGRPWRLRDQKSKVVLLDFWATWCGPCIAAIPHMRKVYDRFKSDPDFVMVGVSQDDDSETLRNFIEHEKLPWIQLYDRSQPLAAAFRIEGIPSVWVIGRDGRVAGGDLHGPELEETIAKELARK